MVNTQVEQTDTPLPWERQNEEPCKYFEWFHVWLLMGPSRSLLGAYNVVQRQSKEKSGKVWKPALDASLSWKTTAQQWKWKTRAAAWDDEQRRKSEEEYEARRRAVQNRMLGIAEQMAEKAELMLRFPITRTPYLDEKDQTVIEPAKWNFNTVPRLTAAIEKLTKDEDETTVSIKSKSSGSGLSGPARSGAVVVLLPSNGREITDNISSDADSDDED